MILEFKLSGYCSFKELQEIYFIPHLGTRLKNTRYQDNFYINSKNKIMKSAVIFGANASGKTSLIRGIGELVYILKHGINLPEEFNFNKLNNESKEIMFEIKLLNKRLNEIYSYKIKYNDEQILEEVLHKGEKLVYSFYENTLKIGEEVKLNIDLGGVFSIKSTNLIAKKIKDYSIVELDEFMEAIGNIELVKEENIHSYTKETKTNIKEKIKELLELNKEKVVNVLTLLDITIKDFKFEKLGNFDNENLYQIYFLRENSEKKYYLGNESEGIKKMIYLMTYFLKLYQGKTIIIDELDSSISTISLIKIFNNIVNTKENKNGQLIVTSHNIFLFNNNILNPQQIYIVNKTEEISSEIYSIDDFNIRTEKENLYLDYLKGKFGGING